MKGALLRGIVLCNIFLVCFCNIYTKEIKDKTVIKNPVKKIVTKKEVKSIKKIDKKKDKSEEIKDIPKDVEIKNPTKEEVWEECIKVGAKWTVPPEILYAVAYAESYFCQFEDTSGKPFYYKGSYGLMQIISKYLDFKVDEKRVRYDWRYNLEIGARELNDKWNMQYNTLKTIRSKTDYLPTVGSGDRMILESWYFVLWAYNHWGDRNNPNQSDKYGFNYQRRLFNLAKKKLGIEITPMPKEWLPEQGLPEIGASYNYPEPVHRSVLFKEKTEKIKAFIKKNIFHSKDVQMVK